MLICSLLLTLSGVKVENLFSVRIEKIGMQYFTFKTEGTKI